MSDAVMSMSEHEAFRRVIEQFLISSVVVALVAADAVAVAFVVAVAAKFDARESELLTACERCD